MSGWRCAGVTFRYPESAHPAVLDLSLEIPSGATTAVLGPNGSGKSTLLRLLLGILNPTAGTAEFGGRRVGEWGRDALARAVGVVPQGEDSVFPVSVRELVGMGRYPHLGAWRREGDADRRAVEEAMRRCDVWALAARPVPTLSGGERQRARVARALAQEAATLALDEPTAALDVAHEMAIFELLRDLGHAGKTVLVVTHNLNLAARYADRLVLLHRGCVAAEGTPAEVLTRSLVSLARVESARAVSSICRALSAKAPRMPAIEPRN
ncbi:MAG TPA: ABC transporter ATP-binding protein [Longimicrobium sp.]|nr:ABC transporter ATP-binding protein [Longimicrobium sp.]